jgi:hypothetical protein
VSIPGFENVTDICGRHTTWFAVGTGVQNKPTGLTATPMDTQVKLTRTAYPGAAQYLVYRCLDPDGTFSQIGTATVNSFVDRGPGDCGPQPPAEPRIVGKEIQGGSLSSAGADDPAGGIRGRSIFELAAEFTNQQAPPPMRTTFSKKPGNASCNRCRAARRRFQS